MRAATCDAHKKRPRLTLEIRARRHEGVREVANWTEASLWKREIMAERSPNVSCAIKVALSSLLGHLRMTKKKELSKSTSTSWTTGLCGQHRKRAAQTAQRRHRSTRRTTPVVHVLVCSKHFCRQFESAGDASLLRLRPAKLMWSHCSQCHVWSEGLKPKDAGMTLIEPWRTVGHWF